MLKNLEDGYKIEVDCFAIFEEKKEDSEEVETILSILSTDGEVYASNSETARKSFLEIFDIFGEDGTFTIEKFSGVTKDDLPFVNIALAM